MSLIAGTIGYLSSHHGLTTQGLSWLSFSLAGLMSLLAQYQYHQAQTQAAKSEPLTAILKQFPLALGITTPKGCLTQANIALCQLTGYSQSDLLAKSFTELIDPRDRPYFEAALWQLFQQQQKHFSLQLRLRKKSGSSIWIAIEASLIHLQAQPSFLVFLLQETHPYQLPAQPQSELISAVSHELKTPLTAIKGSLGLLETGLYHHQPEQTQRMLEIANLECDRLIRLINNILDVERLQAGTTWLQPQICDVSDLLNQAFRSVQPIAAEKSVLLDLEPSGQQVWADPDAVHQILINLIDNAVKFSEVGSTIWITAALDVKGQARNRLENSEPGILFSIRDQGKGIVADRLQLIFERFQFAETSGFEPGRGTGLGLAICKSLVEQQGGQIWAISQLAQGSTFFFTLPQPSNQESYKI
ncbi:MAG: PAS domain S-box protein [Leptolyngbya sp. SIO4C5]|nr:PAS domain S-box protein [Leptolyngbya sp. SIO4C5]